jgi:O-antigen/teichoic acid export membrane protein
MGLEGLGLSQVLQAAFLLIISWPLLRLTIPGISKIPHKFNLQLLREVMPYSLNIQASTAIMFLFDPLTKSLLAKFGGPSIAGLFEVINQIILRVRTLIVAANQVIAPKVAYMFEKQQNLLGELYVKNLRIMLVVAIFVYPSLSIWASSIGELLINKVSDNYLLVFNITLIGWAIDTISVPCYFFNLGRGDVEINTKNYFFMASLNLVLAILLSFYFGWHGILLAYMVALIVSSFRLIHIFHKKNRISIAALNLKVFFNSSFVVLLVLVTHFVIQKNFPLMHWINLIICSCILAYKFKTAFFEVAK